MVIRLSRAPKASSLSYREFQDHWRSEHGPAVTELPGLRRYVQNHSVLDGELPLLTADGYDACAELDFDDVDAMERAFAPSPEAGKVRQDQRSMIDRSRLALAFVEGTVIVSEREPGEDSVKLMLYLESAGGEGSAGHAEALLDAVRAATPAPFQLELLTVVEGAHPASSPAFCDAVVVAWFDTPDQGVSCWEAIDPPPGRTVAPLLARQVRIV